MNGGSDLGRLLVVAGLGLAALGALLLAGSRIGLGHLPGDIVYRKGSFTLYIPIVTSILLSVLLTLLVSFFRR
jgi:hypothetical protein